MAKDFKDFDENDFYTDVELSESDKQLIAIKSQINELRKEVKSYSYSIAILILIILFVLGSLFNKL